MSLWNLSVASITVTSICLGQCNRIDGGGGWPRAPGYDLSSGRLTELCNGPHRLFTPLIVYKQHLTPDYWCYIEYCFDMFEFLLGTDWRKRTEVAVDRFSYRVYRITYWIQIRTDFNFSFVFEAESNLMTVLIIKITTRQHHFIFYLRE